MADILALADDHISGAAEIEARAPLLLRQAIEEPGLGAPAGHDRRLVELARALAAAQPAMAGLFRLANDLLWACEDARGDSARQRRALQFLTAWEEHSATADARLVQAGVDYLAGYPALLTHSRSSTVVAVLQGMAQAGMRPRVYCGESRPLCEGHALARELAGVGLKVILGTDMALFNWLPEVDALVLGADSLSPAGLVNKVGTCALTRIAADLGKPCIVLTRTTKFLPGERVLDHTAWNGPPNEVAPPDALAGAEVRNVVFDRTPLALLSMVICEEGPLDASALKGRLAGLRQHPALARG
ncbi:MAG: eIF2B alpha/beta/delta subunit family protein [Anaerolineae bacterium]